MRDNALNVRLSSCAGLVRQDAVFADIGTDHAYLPIFLLRSGRIKKAYCSDVNPGPLAKAEENVRENGLTDKVELVLTDGAASLGGKGITDYAICGMGGELIAEIISMAPHLKDESLNLILQPMTRQSYLRRFLASEGFRITCESYSIEGKRSYVCFAVIYTGEPVEIDDVEAEICCKSAKIVNKDLQISYLKGKYEAFKKMVEGKKRGGEDSDKEEKILLEIEKYINEGRNDDC